jgi:NAD-dependent dihydropyrimidine dehydrogenase PreA subunit
MALSTGLFPNVSAVKNEADSQCPDGNPVSQCEAVRESVTGTMQLMQDDGNEGFTGWIGYERTNTDCTDCSRTCTTHVFWEDGKPTEKMRFLFIETQDNEIVVKL